MQIKVEKMEISNHFASITFKKTGKIQMGRGTPSPLDPLTDRKTSTLMWSPPVNIVCRYTRFCMWDK